VYQVKIHNKHLRTAIKQNYHLFTGDYRLYFRSGYNIQQAKIERLKVIKIFITFYADIIYRHAESRLIE
jgi:hypothetical protein